MLGAVGLNRVENKDTVINLGKSLYILYAFFTNALSECLVRKMLLCVLFTNALSERCYYVCCLSTCALCITKCGLEIFAHLNS